MNNPDDPSAADTHVDSIGSVDGETITFEQLRDAIGARHGVHLFLEDEYGRRAAVKGLVFEQDVVNLKTGALDDGPMLVVPDHFAPVVDAMHDATDKIRVELCATYLRARRNR